MSAEQDAKDAEARAREAEANERASAAENREKVGEDRNAGGGDKAGGDAGDKGGDFAKTAYQGLGFALLYTMMQRVFHVIAEVPAFVTRQTNKYFPSATINGEITPEYLGVGYIIGPKISPTACGSA